MSTAKDTLAELLSNCEKGPYRGEDKHYDRVSSNLYREYEDSKDESRILKIEKGIIKRAKKHIHPNPKNIDVLTELQHYGGHTNLIDFTKNILIALFFACDGEDKNDGRIIQIKNGVKIEEEIDYNTEYNNIIMLNPPGKGTRAIFQSSVFLYSSSGFIDENLYTHISIKGSLKKEILSLLKGQFNICRDTIYNDIQGFIRNQRFYAPKATAKYNETEGPISENNNKIEKTKGAENV